MQLLNFGSPIILYQCLVNISLNSIFLGHIALLESWKLADFTGIESRDTELPFLCRYSFFYSSTLFAMLTHLPPLIAQALLMHRTSLRCSLPHYQVRKFQPQSLKVKAWLLVNTHHSS